MVYAVSEFDKVAIPAATCALLQAVTETLLQKYGATMGFAEIGAEIGISAGAARLRQFRLGDLPEPIPCLRENRWRTTSIALWFCGIAIGPEGKQPSDRTVMQRQTRGRGRPRKLTLAIAGEGQS